MNLLKAAKEQMILMDGAMGTYYSSKYLSGLEAEQANLLHPEQVVEIHKDYLRAGARLLRTNTFAVNHELFSNPEECRASILAAVDCAKRAVADSGVEAWIGASIGPIRQSISDSEEEIFREYCFLIDSFIEKEIEIFIFETFSEPKWIARLSRYCKEKNSKSIVFAQFSMKPMGYTQFGFGMQELIRQAGEIPEIDVVGFNCGIGVSHMKKLLLKQLFPERLLISVLPNAGYQHELRGRMYYQDEPEYYADQMLEIMKAGIRFAGGCCGTTPEHIAALARKSSGHKLYEKRVIKEHRRDAQIEVQPTAFVEKLNSGEKVYVVELDAPFDASSEKFRKGVLTLKEHEVDIVTVSDSPLARARADASLLAVYAKQCAEIEVMPHIAMRDRNLIGLRAEVLGAHINGIRDMLIITGDPVAQDDRGSITGVFDLNSIRFMEYLKHMNEEIFGEHPVFYGGALNYAGVNVKAIINRMQKKMEAGCSYFLTQPIFSDDDIARIKEIKAQVNAKVICGIMPIVSYRNALFMQKEMPGIHVDEAIVTQYTPDMSREEAEETAIRISVEIAEKLSDVADGYYIMTPFHRVSLVTDIIENIRKHEK